MKKLLGVLLGGIVGIAVAAGILLNIHTSSSIKSQVSENPATQVAKAVLPKVAAPTPKPVSIPQRISIPAIGVDAAVESVGLDASGNMDVPKTPSDTAWYNLGFKPGENGSAVIDGHLDDIHARPAVFWNLSKLRSGDTIVVTSADGTKYTFVVNRVVSYPVNNLPLHDIFATSGTPGLNLITCDGIYKRSSGGYTNRIVVYSQLQS